jgi:asparagine synthase (glutamine-hydrolysing)
MPGIAGIVSDRPAQQCQQIARAMAQSMATEAFYRSGRFHAPDLGVYCGWVAHKGSLSERVCSSASSGDVSILLAGECFVDGEYAPTIEAAPRCGKEGAAWLNRSYEAKGEDFVSDLNGMFAGLVVDRQRGLALLFNDRFAMERIYYHERDGTMYFASEAKALLRVCPELRQFDEHGVAQFLTFGCTMAGRTLFRKLESLHGGTLIEFKGKKVSRQSRYFQPEAWEESGALSEASFEDSLRKQFPRILRRYTESNERIGISLTGGLDTRMIMACFPESAPAPVCYTFVGLTGETIDARLGRQVARVRGAEHHLIHLTTEFLSAYGAHVDRTVYATDGCSGALGAHEMFFNARARDLAPVRLTGNFGSEVLRSMSTFKALHLAKDTIDPELCALMQSTESEWSGQTCHPVSFAAFREIPWKLWGAYAASRSQVIFRSPFLDNEIVRLAYRAPATSRASVRASHGLIAGADPRLGAIPTDLGLVWGERSPRKVLRRARATPGLKLD